MNRAQVSAEDLHSLLEKEVRKLRSGDEWTRWLDAAAVFHEYSFRNVVLITLQMPDASWVAGYHAWRKLGRQVMKNQRGIRILAPVLARLKPEPPGDATPKQKDDIAEPETGTRIRGRVIGFRVATVWDVTQTAGPPIPQPPTPGPVVGAVPTGLWDALAKEVASNGFTLARRSTGDGSEGYTDYVDREIVVADHLDDVTAVARLAHEVGHMRMHSAEEVAGAGSIMCRGVREVEAESIAYIVLAHHGLKTNGSSFPYVAGWASTVDQNEPEKVIQSTGARVVSVARELIESTSRHLKAEREAAGRTVRPAQSPSSLALPESADVEGPGL